MRHCRHLSMAPTEVNANRFAQLPGGRVVLGGRAITHELEMAL